MNILYFLIHAFDDLGGGGIVNTLTQMYSALKNIDVSSLMASRIMNGLFIQQDKNRGIFLFLFTRVVLLSYINETLI